jgi:AcrR family transcriptional regulator
MAEPERNARRAAKLAAKLAAPRAKRDAPPNAARDAKLKAKLEAKVEAKLNARRDARRGAIVDVARTVFFEEGYAAASMSAIAARLGGSKGTLYNYFDSKEALFEAYIDQACGRWRARIFDLPTGADEIAAADVETVLCDLGERFLGHLLSDEAIRLFQLVTAEAKRAPELAAAFYEAGPGAGIARLTAYLEAAKAAGLIDPPDRRVAAEQFLSLCKGGLYLRYSLNLVPRPTDSEVRAEVARAVSLFLAAYRR